MKLVQEHTVVDDSMNRNTKVSRPDNLDFFLNENDWVEYSELQICTDEWVSWDLRGLAAF